MHSYDFTWSNPTTKTEIKPKEQNKLSYREATSVSSSTNFVRSQVLKKKKHDLMRLYKEGMNF